MTCDHAARAKPPPPPTFVGVRSLTAVALLAGSSLAARCQRSPSPIAAPADHCEDHEMLSVDLGGVGGQPLDRVTWRRCAGVDPNYPTHRLLLAMHGVANAVELYTNDGGEAVGGLRSVEVVRLTDKGQQLLWVEEMYGTGNIFNWRVVDWRNGKLRTWSEPDDGAALEKLKKKKDEEITHQEGEGPVVDDRKFVLGYVIREAGECNACASGGYAKIELLARDGAFELIRAWREAGP